GTALQTLGSGEPVVRLRGGSSAGSGNAPSWTP
ncbi:hypothetical protein HMPREF1030_05602, partial [Pseudomonas aeruginosa]